MGTMAFISPRLEAMPAGRWASGNLPCAHDTTATRAVTVSAGGSNTAVRRAVAAPPCLVHVDASAVVGAPTAMLSDENQDASFPSSPSLPAADSGTRTACFETCVSSGGDVRTCTCREHVWRGYSHLVAV